MAERGYGAGRGESGGIGLLGMGEVGFCLVYLFFRDLLLCGADLIF